jgi:hypothetical protein
VEGAISSGVEDADTEVAVTVVDVVPILLGEGVDAVRQRGTQRNEETDQHWRSKGETTKRTDQIRGREEGAAATQSVPGSVECGGGGGLGSGRVAVCGGAQERRGC